MAHELSEYEKVRLANILRNEEFLKSIGLNDIKQTIADSGAVTASTSSSSSSRGSRSNRSWKRPANEEPYNAPTRRSSRQTVTSCNDYSGLPLPLQYNPDDFPDTNKAKTVRLNDTKYDDGTEKKPFTAQHLSEFIELTNPSHSEVLKSKVRINLFAVINLCYCHYYYDYHDLHCHCHHHHYHHHHHQYDYHDHHHHHLRHFDY
jgi:hypothetical protein